MPDQLELVRLAVLMVGDLATAEDAVQDAFEQLHRRWRTLRKPSNALRYAPGDGTQWRGEIRVIDLATGKTRTWTAPVHDGHYFIPGPPSWADGDRMLAFTWQVSKNLTTTNTVMHGVRLLDTSAPGGDLMNSRQIVSSRAVQGTIQSALITPDGRNVIVAASREVPSGGRGTVVGQISEVFSFDPAGRYALVQNMQFGWMDIGGPDPGRFTPLPGSRPAARFSG